MITEAEAAWAAGFLDGEGCFNISRCGGRPRTGRILASQVVRAPLDELVRLFGGNVYRRPASSGRHSSRGIWAWELRAAEDVVAAVDAVYPYLRVKGTEARLVRDYARLKRTRPGGVRLSVDEAAGRLALANQLAEVKAQAAGLF